MKKKFLTIFLLLVSATVFAKQGTLPDFTGLVKQTASAVVNITARKNADEQVNGPNEQNEQLYRFFGIPDGRQRPQDRISGGSGFLISADGYVLTNRHVVYDMDEITVKLSDRREFYAKLIGEDEASDIALLKLDEKNLPFLKTTSTNTLEIGEWVMAIGSPLSFEHTVTKGIISAKGRSLRGQQYIPYLQSDVPINRGNSGGPLINMDGKVVGINTLILSNTGGYMGLSFSIPIEIAMNVANQLKEHGVVKRGLLGVGIENVNQDMADYLKMDKPRGALINNISKDSAADKSGFKVGDVIVEFNGSPIITSGSLPPIVGNTMPNTEVDVRVFRDGKEIAIVAVLDELSDSTVISSNSSTPGEVEGVGFKVAGLSESDQQRTGETTGVLVKSISIKNVQRAGLRVGDVIKKIGKDEITSIKDFKKAIKNRKDDEPLVLLIKQGMANRFIVIE